MFAAAWLTAAATTLLAALAGVTAWYARGAYQAQAKQLRLLEQQHADQQAFTRQQIQVLDLQAGELTAVRDKRALDAAQQHRAQATRVLTWQEHHPRDPRTPQVQAYFDHLTGQTREPRPVLAVHVSNTSDQPVRDIEIRWHRGTARAGDPDQIQQILPGTEETVYREVPPETIPAAFGAAVVFRDADGVTWLRRDDGELLEQPTDSASE
jgi:hypothetical protein